MNLTLTCFCSLTELASRVTSETFKILLPFVVGNDRTPQEVCLPGRVGASPSTSNRGDTIANSANLSHNHGLWIKNRQASKAGRLLLPLVPRCESSPRQWRMGFARLAVGLWIQKTASSVGLLSRHPNAFRLSSATVHGETNNQSCAGARTRFARSGFMKQKHSAVAKRRRAAKPQGNGKTN